MRFKTLNQLMKNHDDTWLYQGINEDYKLSIQPWFRDWFDYRFLCVDSSYQSDDMWQVYFRRVVNLYGDRYWRMLQNQITNFDPTLISVFTSTVTNTSTTTEDASTDTTKTSTASGSNSSTANGSDNTEASSTGNSTTNNTVAKSGTSRNIASDYPQSNVKDNIYGWTYASQGSDVTETQNSTNEETSTETTSNKNKLTHEATITGSNETTRKDTDKTTNNLTRDNTGTANIRNETTGDKVDQYTRMLKFIRSCDATNWMIEKLDTVFLSLYEVDKDEMEV